MEKELKTDYMSLISELNNEKSSPQRKINRIDKFCEKYPGISRKDFPAGTFPCAVTQILGKGKGWATKNLSQGNLRVLEALLKYDLGPDNGKSRYLHPIACTVKNDDVRATELLLEDGANPNCVEGDEDMPVLFQAALNGSYDMVDLLLAAGAKINHKTKGPLYGHRGSGPAGILACLHRVYSGPQKGRETLEEVFTHTRFKDFTDLAQMAHYLIEHGASLTAKNGTKKLTLAQLNEAHPKNFLYSNWKGFIKEMRQENQRQR